MSKYIKLEDAIYEDCILIDEIKCEDCPFYDEKHFLCRMVKWLDSLPTIEVSEISRDYLEELYWQTLIPKGMINTDIELGINIGIDKMYDVIKNAPSVVSTTDENKCHRHGIRLEDGTPVYECIGCDEQDCKRKG